MKSVTPTYSQNRSGKLVPNGKYSIVVIDLDGTLIGFNETIQAEVRSVIEEVISRDVKIVIASGRVHRRIKEYAQQLGIKEPLISHSGALVKDDEDKIIYKAPIAEDTAIKIDLFARENNLQTFIYYEDMEPLVFASLPHRKTIHFLDTNNIFVEYRDDLTGVIREQEEGPLSILLRKQNPLSLKEKTQQIKREFCDDDITVRYCSSKFIEITNSKATKYHALQAILNHKNWCAENVISVGDDYNDVDLFINTPYSVSMSHAPKSVKQHASEICEGNIEECLVQIFKRHVL